jgi:predicted aldo/keto reductase-like oxidoreductase
VVPENTKKKQEDNYTMIYSSFGRSNIKVSRLGFGCMRLPLKHDQDPASIDEVKAKQMLDYAVDHGINIIDNAWPYHREASEKFIGRALSNASRKKVLLSTKMPIWLIRQKSDLEKYFNKQLKRLQTDIIDLYMLHALNKKTWPKVYEHDIFGFINSLKSKKKIQLAGFSFHDDLSLFKKIIDAYAWDFCLIHLNYVDDDFQAGFAGLKYANKKGLAVMIMEPLRGAKLANKVPDDIIDLIKQTGRDQTPAEFALRWVYNRPEVTCVLSGMSTLKQVQENITFASEEHTSTLSSKELAIYEKAKKLYRAKTAVNCTMCGYCLPCKQGIPISFILELYNDVHMYGALENSQWMYDVFIKPENRADQCISCGECEEKCPQKIPIAEHLAKAHQILSKRPD